MLSEAWLGTWVETTQMVRGLGTYPAEARAHGNEPPVQVVTGSWRLQSLKGLQVSPAGSFSAAGSSPFISCSGWYT